MLGASLPENGNRASLIRWKEDCVSELLSCSVLSFGFLDPWNWDWWVVGV